MPVNTVIKPRRSIVPAAQPNPAEIEFGELVLNIPDGKFYTKDQYGSVLEVGGAGAITLQGVTDNSAVTTNSITLNGGNLIFEGLIENAFETTLTVAEPTQDRVITLPNQSGTIAMDGDALAYSIVFGG